MHRFFKNKTTRRILTDPDVWRLIYRGCDVAPVSRPTRAQREWLRRNLHSHACIDIMVVLGGGWYGSDGRVFDCKQGAVFVFFPHELHPSGYPPSRDNFEHLWISVAQNKIFTRVLTAKRGKLAYVNDINLRLTIEQCGLTQRFFDDDVSEDELKLRATTITAALFSGITAAIKQKTTPVPDSQTMVSAKMDAISRHILETGGRDGSLDYLAHLAGYSKFHFLRLFKKHTGKTVHEYVNDCRKRKIRELAASGLNMKEIAARLNFASSSSFAHWLRKHD